MKYIASWSGGKDSTATIILAHEHNEPIDLIIFSEVMFDNEISGELPEHIDFIKHKCIPLFESWGYEVRILHSDRTYMDCFFHVVNKSKQKDRIGKHKGFVMRNHCDVQRDCKLRPIKKFWKSIKGDFVQYIGVAVDEPVRLERVVKTKNQTSLLQKYGYTEQMALELCKQYDLLSPIYDFSPRGGCWFCPNTRDYQLRYLRKNHRDLWDKLLELEETPNLIADVWDYWNKVSIHDKEKQFTEQDRGKRELIKYVERLNSGS